MTLHATSLDRIIEKKETEFSYNISGLMSMSRGNLVQAVCYRLCNQEKAKRKWRLAPLDSLPSSKCRERL